MNDRLNLLYSDFNCPFCYAMHERLYEMNLLTRCEWRGVQHASHLPRPMKPWQGWRPGYPLRFLLANRIRGRRLNRPSHFYGAIQRI
jgi:hypothetical protein